MTAGATADGVEAAASADLGVVVIGRNEGERLVRCIGSLPAGARIVYVDSGSTDGSVAAAERAGARVVALDMAQPFTAARARNAGRAALPPACTLIQFVDGDCVMRPDWPGHARAALGADGSLGAVFGRRREVHPEASVYNWLCDVEWDVPPGPALYFGGDVLMRAEALDQAGGYPAEMIAGEEPDLALRMRARGWQVACLSHEMTLHDAAITRLSQWWRRTLRSGHAYAELAHRHAGSALQNYGGRMRATVFWGAAIPLGAALLLLVAAIVPSGTALLLAGLVLLLPLAQLARLTLRERRRWPLRQAFARAWFLMLGKPAQALGIARFWQGRLGGSRSRIIEYKGQQA